MAKKLFYIVLGAFSGLLVAETAIMFKDGIEAFGFGSLIELGVAWLVVLIGFICWISGIISGKYSEKVRFVFVPVSEGEGENESVETPSESETDETGETETPNAETPNENET